MEWPDEGSCGGGGQATKIETLEQRNAELEKELITTQGARDRYWHKATELEQQLANSVPPCKYRLCSRIGTYRCTTAKDCPMLAGEE